ncbi:Imm49 family immunity protein [Streptomyces cucumeris]|uniref:Imm49 family immunity protein n=1 Tax=Streptomyces cucumeris TaxID=2962890 RepID=UPI003EBE0BF2
MALHDYLRAEDPLPATEHALEEVELAKDWKFFPPPAVLFSQRVEGDEESFDLALADALEAHRDHYQVAARLGAALEEFDAQHIRAGARQPVTD